MKDPPPRPGTSPRPPTVKATTITAVSPVGSPRPPVGPPVAPRAPMAPKAPSPQPPPVAPVVITPAPPPAEPPPTQASRDASLAPVVSHAPAPPPPAPPPLVERPPPSEVTGVDFNPGLREEVRQTARMAVSEEAHKQAAAAVAEALAPLHKQIRDLEVRLARAESRLDAEPTLAEVPRKPAGVSPIATSVGAPPKVDVPPPAVSVMPVKVISTPPPPPDVAPATVVMPNRPAPPPATATTALAPRPSTIDARPSFDLTPDYRDLPDLLDGQRRRKRIGWTVAVLLLVGVGGLLAAMFASRG